MARLRPLAAVLLLAAFAVGGLGMPVLHEVAHAGETMEALAHRADADHHHHTALDDHGREALPPCPEALDGDLTCVPCASVSAAASFEEAAPVPPVDEGAEAAPAPLHVARGHEGAQTIRGPPALV